MPQSHPTTGPYNSYHPYDFLPVRPSEAPAGILCGCCSHGHFRLRPHTAWHGCILVVWMNNSQDSTGTPCDAHTGIIWAPHGNLRCFSFPMGPIQGPCMIYKGAVQRPYGHVRELTQPELAKIPHGHHIWPCRARTGSLQSLHGMFTGCLQYLNPYGARKLIMHALKLYGLCTGRQNSYGAPRGPCGPLE